MDSKGIVTKKGKDFTVAVGNQVLQERNHDFVAEPMVDTLSDISKEAVQQTVYNLIL